MTESTHIGTESTGERVMKETSATAGQAKQAASQVAGTAAEQAKTVVGEARQQAGNALGDLRGRAMEEADGQARRAAGVLRQWAQDLSGLAEHAQGDSPARHLAAQAADRGHRTADYLDKQGVEGLVSDLQNFARRRPGAFLGGAVLAGLAVGRLAKAATNASRPDGQDQGRTTGERDLGEMRTPAPTALPAGSTTDRFPETPLPPAAPPVVGTSPDGVPGTSRPEV
ncbi:hypothetical protein ACICHK_37925 [Streptomyces sp. AHU1]|uniref:hypothetical protein n=1 Tax=Streptomyces sp. AHU1 TaxID=3377215 RepID=UPI003878427F